MNMNGCFFSYNAFILLLAWMIPAEARDQGFFMLEGDLITTPKQVLKLRMGGGDNKGRMAMFSEANRWPNATVYYTVALTSFTINELKELRWALDQYEQETCLKFKEATPETPNYVVVREGSSGCGSELGLTSTWANVQVLNLEPDCRHYGLILHEFGHTIGLYHEHQNPMRESQIKIKWHNIMPKMRTWFKPITHPFKAYGAPYDIQSVMHYGGAAFSKDGSSLTMKTKDPKRQKLMHPVWLKDLSFYDVYKINAMYRCAEHCGDVSCPDDNFVNKECKCVSKEAFAKRRCINVDKDCDTKKDKCETDSFIMYPRCRKTCKACYVPE